MLYHRVSDLPELVARLESEGVEIVTVAHVIFAHEDDTLGPAGTDEWQAFIRDSEGNTID